MATPFVNARGESYTMPIGNVKGANPRALSALQAVQAAYGSPLSVARGASSNLGGNHSYEGGRSDHDVGMGFDIDISGMSNGQKLQVLDAAKQAGFFSFGLGSNVLHVGMHGAPRAWTYGGSGKAGIGGSNSIVGGKWAGVPMADLKADIIASPRRGLPAGLGGGAIALADAGAKAPPAIAAVNDMAAGQPARTLRKGMTGDDVRALQGQLASAGLYNGKIDGDFGRQTAFAVRAAESLYGLNRDKGAAGPQVLGRLAGNATARDITDLAAMQPGGIPAPSGEGSADYLLHGFPQLPGPAQAPPTLYAGERGRPGGSRFAFGAPQQLDFTPRTAPSVVGDEMAGSGGMTSGGPPSSMLTAPAELNGVLTAGGGVPGASATMALTPMAGMPPGDGGSMYAGLTGLNRMTSFDRLAQAEAIGAGPTPPAPGRVPQVAMGGGPVSFDTMSYLDNGGVGRAIPKPVNLAGSRYDGAPDIPQPMPPDAQVVAGDFSPRPDYPAPNNVRGTSISDVLAGIGGVPNAIFGADGPIMSASRTVNGWLGGGDQPATARPSLYDRVPPAVDIGAGLSSPAMPGAPQQQSYYPPPTGGLGGMPQFAGPGASQQAPDYLGGAAKGDRLAGVPLSAPRGDKLAITPAGGVPAISSGIAGITFGDYDTQGQPGVQFDALPAYRPPAPVTTTPKNGGSAIGRLIDAGLKAISGNGGHPGGAGAGGAIIPSQSYGGSPGAYSFAGMTPWGSATYQTPGGGFSNSPFTPGGFTAPNFSQGSGGATYAYKPNGYGGGTFVTSDGRTLSY